MNVTTQLPKTLRETFSFYVTGRKPERIRECAEIADAIIVAGVRGPRAVQQLRQSGWEGTALFDSAQYQKQNLTLDAQKWFEEQREAGADRLLTPGLWVGSEPGHLSFEALVEPEAVLATDNKATCLLAIDRHWLTKSNQVDEMGQCLSGLTVPVALVLGDRGDPMGYSGAVDGLVAISKSVDNLSILRCDQAGIGALAFGAAHASLGLTTSHRHAVPPGVKSFARRNDFSARVFVKDLLDWFTASRISEWSTANVRLTCQESCCGGQRLDRFLDERLSHEADLHNRTTLAAFAEEVLDAPTDEGIRRNEFRRLCHEAVARYGSMGRTEIKPKPQLTHWALYC